MHHTIILKCQLQKTKPACEDCLAFKTCNLQKKAANHRSEAPSEFAELFVQLR